MTDCIQSCREVIADRGAEVLVTTNDVLDCIKEFGGEKFNTRDVADALRGKCQADYHRLEYSVRQAISWLIKRGHVKVADGLVKRYTQVNHSPYWCTVYELVDAYQPDESTVQSECDCALLNRIFFRL